MHPDLTYSVWNHHTKRYDYFLGPRLAGTHAMPPVSSSSQASQLGGAPELSGYPLPANATPAGSGPTAKGRISYKPGASQGGAIFGLGAWGDREARDGLVIVLAVAAFYIYRKVLS